MVKQQKKHSRKKRSSREFITNSAQGSRKNKFTILSIKASGWQGAKAQEYQAHSELS